MKEGLLKITYLSDGTPSECVYGRDCSNVPFFVQDNDGICPEHLFQTTTDIECNFCGIYLATKLFEDPEDEHFYFCSTCVTELKKETKDNFEEYQKEFDKKRRKQKKQKVDELIK